MIAARIPDDEEARIQALHRCSILDTLPEKEYDQITELAANICESKVSLVSLVDVDRQWFKSANGIDATETPRDLAFCAHAILNSNEPLIIEDATKDERFVDNDLVTGPTNIRFYAGFPLTLENGYSLGTLCVIDSFPRTISLTQIRALEILADNVVSLLELRKSKLGQQKLIQKLSRSNKGLEQFAYIASHDLQEPIRMISAYTGLLESKYKSNLDGEADSYIDYIVDGCKRMQLLVDSLLELSLIESSKVNIESVDCNKVLEDVMSDLAIKTKETDAQVIWSDMPTLMVEPNQIRTVFRNLISNAMKYCVDRAPEIIIGADQQGEDIKFFVKDNGIGIEEKYQEKIFELFKRLHARNDFTGTGIGLTITKKIVERHGGELTLESTVGVGTTFYFTIPVGGRVINLKT